MTTKDLAYAEPYRPSQDLAAIPHYIRQATASNHWFDFTQGRVEFYCKRYGEDFCLIINGSHQTDDAYIIPFSFARKTFTREALDARNRWVGTIEGARLHLSTSGSDMNVAPYYNAFHLVGL